MFTAFLTKCLSSLAARRIRTNPCRNCSSEAALSCTVSDHNNAKPARLTNSASCLLHLATLRHACEVRSNRLKHNVSQMPQLSKSRTHESICAEVTSAGSSTNEVSIRASYQPVFQSAWASS